MLDGVIAGAAALVAAALCPAASTPASPGTARPSPATPPPSRTWGCARCVDLELRLGEGTGALLALPLVQGAVRVLHEVATFDAAGRERQGRRRA